MLALKNYIIITDVNNKIRLFNALNGKKMLEIESPDSFNITALIQPENYANRVKIKTS